MRTEEMSEITRAALERGREYHVVATTMLRAGLIRPDDRRVRARPMAPDAPVTGSCRDFVEEARARHEEARACAVALRGGVGRGSSLRGVPEGLRASLALQSTLLGAVARSGDHRGAVAGGLATALERTAVHLGAAGGSRAPCERLACLAARTVDGVVLAERHRGWEGLAADVMVGSGLDAPTTARGLRRDGLLGSDDPRGHPDQAAIEALETMGAGAFEAHLVAQLRAQRGAMGHSDDPAFSRAAVGAEIARLPDRPAGDETDAARFARRAEEMGLLARALERTAVNRHATGGPEAASAVGDLLATSVSAAHRSVCHAHQARQTGLRTGAPVRDRGAMLM